MIPELALAAAAPPLLRRMRGEFEEHGRLTGPTTTAMYAGYLAHAALYVRSLRSGSAAGRWVRFVGLGSATAGAALCVAGMGRFQGPAQVSGVSTGTLAETGVYRINRNPQYTGYLLLLTGGALAARSPRALALALAAAGIFAWWVPVEEAALARTFGEDYRRYRQRTRRWL